MRETTTTSPPQNLDAERALLGAMMIEGAEAFRKIGWLTPAALSLDAHRVIFSAMRCLFDRTAPVDLITVGEELRRVGQLEFVGGPAALALLVEQASIATNLPAYAVIVADCAQRREYLALGFRLTSANGAPAAELAAMVREHEALARAVAPANGANGASDYIETLTEFLGEDDPPVEVIFPDLLPCGVIMMIHGDPRARKTLAAAELALSAATGTPPFGLERFRPAAPMNVLYVQEEDPRSLTRPRLRRLVRERCGGDMPATLHVSVRRGVDLDDPVWVARLIEDSKRLAIRLLVLDAARRFSVKTDEGPAKVRELVAVLRSIVTTAGVTLVIVHHDVKPPSNGQDQRRRSQRASGGDWFAACECPVHVERVNGTESLVFPQDYKFSADPAPFTFECKVDAGLITHLVGIDTSTDQAERAGVRGKVLDWLRANGPATRTDIKKAGIAQWPAIEAALDLLIKDGKADATPGRKAGSLRYFAIGEPSSTNSDGSLAGVRE